LFPESADGCHERRREFNRIAVASDQNSVLFPQTVYALFSVGRALSIAAAEESLKTKIKKY